VNQQNPTCFEPNNQIFAAPLDGVHGLSYELGRDLPGIVRTRQARVCDFDTLESSPDEVRLEPGPDRLDLG
jgi:hypothetical protein